MKVIRIAEIETVPIATATPIPGWTGGDVKRTRQPILPEGFRALPAVRSDALGVEGTPGTRH